MNIRKKCRRRFEVKILHIINFMLTLIISTVQAQNRPFPQQVNFTGCIKPSNVTQESMNTVITSYFQKWKASYLKKSDGGEVGNGYYINMKGTGGSGTEVTTSEAHGYGMIVFALMAGYDDSAKIYYDGMVNLFDLHRSTINRNLMSWVIDPVNGDNGGATDGDMDIAYSLLLADNQWGSDGQINYKAKADSIINLGIKGSDVRSSGSKRTTLGDWDEDLYNTRSSDWMPGHMRAYYGLTKDKLWLEASDTIYSLISQLSSKYSPSTGLMPDFIIGKNPEPAKPDFLESETDGDYSWNACRFPWRITMDYAHYGTPAAKQSLHKILTWLKSTTSNVPENIAAGYHLDGSVIDDYQEVAFIAPFIAACVCDATHQEYLNDGWNIIKNAQGDYYGDSIGLLCLLLISGNWWKPDFSQSIANQFTHKAFSKHDLTCSAILKNSVLTVTSNLPAHLTANISLLDFSGRICKEVQKIRNGYLPTLRFDMDLSALKSGIYIINFSSAAGVKRIIINYIAG